MRSLAPRSNGSKCSRLTAISSKQKSFGMPSIPQGRAFGSKTPTISSPASYRKYEMAS